MRSTDAAEWPLVSLCGHSGAVTVRDAGVCAFACEDVMSAAIKIGTQHRRELLCDWFSYGILTGTVWIRLKRGRGAD
jgi:hypothetical protein